MVCRLLASKGNRTGAVLFSGKIERMIPAKGGGGEQLLNSARCLEPLSPISKADPAPPWTSRAFFRMPCRRDQAPLAYLHCFGLHRRTGAGKSHWGRLASRQHDVIAVRLMDPLELRLLDLGILLTFQDAESGEQGFCRHP